MARRPDAAGVSYMDFLGWWKGAAQTAGDGTISDATLNLSRAAFTKADVRKDGLLRPDDVSSALGRCSPPLPPQCTSCLPAPQRRTSITPLKLRRGADRSAANLCGGVRCCVCACRLGRCSTSLGCSSTRPLQLPSQRPPRNPRLSRSRSRTSGRGRSRRRRQCLLCLHRWRTRWLTTIWRRWRQLWPSPRPGPPRRA
jgi:hypothetical protein